MKKFSQKTSFERPASRDNLSSFTEMVKSYDHDLRGVVWGVIGNHIDIDDVMQIAYEKAFLAFPKFEGRSSVKTWLHTICYRSAIDHIRSQREILDDDEILLDKEAAEKVESQVLDGMEVLEVLELLKPSQRALVLLTAWQGYSFEEAAEIIRLPRGTVSSQLTRARKKLSIWRAQ